MRNSLHVAAALLFAASPALAITAEEVMTKMSKQERVSYLIGLADMLSYQSVLTGNRAHAECVTQKSSDETVLKRIYAALEKFPTKAPEGILVVVMKQECGG